VCVTACADSLEYACGFLCVAVGLMYTYIDYCVFCVRCGVMKFMEVCVCYVCSCIFFLCM